jgi:hypothetical protein
MLAYAKRSVPFYGNAFAAMPDHGIETLTDLQWLPFTTTNTRFSSKK